MYAVVETGGKQYKVAVGDKLKVEKLSAEEGASVGLDRVLLVADGDNVTVGSPIVEIPVTATVLSHGKDKKIRVFKMKRRKNYRRTQGHRQLFTEIEITGIGSYKGSAKKESTPKEAASKETSPKKSQSEKPIADSKSEAVESIGDLLTTINGIGPVIEKKLKAMGITTFKQIAEFDQEKIDEVNEQLSFKGRIEREQWVEQAKELVD